MTNEDAFAPLIGDVLAAVGLSALAGVQRINVGTICDAFRVETPGRTVFVRFSQPGRDLTRVLTELRALLFAAGKGIPVAQILASADGDIAHAVGDRIGVVYEWVEGRPLARETMTPGEIDTLGELHGRVQRALAPYTDPNLIPRMMGSFWSTERSIARFRSLLARVGGGTPFDDAARAVLRRHLALLEDASVAMPATAFEGMTAQVCHCDYTERNVMVDRRGFPVALVDWDNVTIFPPALELQRTLAYAHLLEPWDACERYLRAFGRTNRLPRDDAEGAVEMWWQSTLHNTWVFDAYYHEQNRRVAAFVLERSRELSWWGDERNRTRLKHLIREHCT